MALSFLDIGLLAIMAISGILALMRGFTREILSIASWGAAAGASVLAYLRLKDWAREQIQPNYLADAVLIGVTFLIVLIVVSFVTARISDAILDSKIGALDRTLGLAFGVARGLVIVVIAWLFFNWLVPQQSQPAWAREARAKPHLDRIGAWIMSQLPEDPERALEQFRRRRDGGGEAPADQPPAGGAPRPAPAAPGGQQRSDAPQGQTAQARQGLDQLIRNTQQGQPAR
jgi:membrane protein required for colicin V production